MDELLQIERRATEGKEQMRQKRDRSGVFVCVLFARCGVKQELRLRQMPGPVPYHKMSFMYAFSIS